MKFSIVLILMIFCINCYSQKTVYSIQPNWNHNILEVIKSQNIKSDSVYFYKEKTNNKDSTLIITQYFDSLGNLIERNEFNLNKEAFRITDYTYMDTVLLKKETMSKDMFYINGSDISKKITTYEYDSLGYAIAEKEYSFFGNPLKLISTTKWDRDYDSLGHLIKEFITLPKSKTYLSHSYIYTNGRLTEMKTYDINQTWMYSNLYQYDEIANTKSVYLFNNVKRLSHEFIYDGKRILMEKDYDLGNYLDHTTQFYFYKPNGLLESQTFEDPLGNHYYFKHYYSK